MNPNARITQCFGACPFDLRFEQTVVPFLEELPVEDALAQPVLNAPLIGQRLGYPELSGLDLLELFAFLRPASFAVPTPAGLGRALGLQSPVSEAEAAASLRQIGTLPRGRDGVWGHGTLLGSEGCERPWRW